MEMLSLANLILDNVRILGEKVGYRLGRTANLSPQMESMLKTLETVQRALSDYLNSSKELVLHRLDIAHF